MKCKHIFHNKCILAWLSKNNRTCPLCREVLRPTPDRVWVSLPQGFVSPSPLPHTPALRKLLNHENKTPTPLPNMRYGLSFHRQAKGTATLLSPIEMNYLKDFLSTAGYGDEECVRLLARACGPFSHKILTASNPKGIARRPNSYPMCSRFCGDFTCKIHNSDEIDEEEKNLIHGTKNECQLDQFMAEARQISLHALNGVQSN
uniref:RING-type domain-containing protein n=1 Tax=Tanacetum cinerariifolium TaxID=118510 RepID=A0A6L2KFG1_TANCI|nr:hypothetical protein [Tanacetum cinerariifolium]